MSQMYSDDSESVILNQQLDGCIYSFKQLLLLISSTLDRDTLRSLHQGRIDISKAIIALNELISDNTTQWKIGNICNVRRHDGYLDIGIITDILAGVFSTDDDEPSLPQARICWLRPRNMYELSSAGFLVSTEQLLRLKPGWQDSEAAIIQKCIYIWGVNDEGYLEKMEMISHNQNTIQCINSIGKQIGIVDSEYLHFCPIAIEHVSIHAAEDGDENSEDGESDAIVLPVDPSMSLGQWERHTKSFGSRMMQKMGYERGKGLGPASNGRSIPVDAHVTNKKTAGIGFNKTSVSNPVVSGQGPVAVAVVPPRRDLFCFLNSLEVNRGAPAKDKNNDFQTPINAQEMTPKSLGVNILVLIEAEEKLKNKLSRLKEGLNRNKPNLITGYPGDPRLAAQMSVSIDATEKELVDLRKRRAAVGSQQSIISRGAGARRSGKHLF